MNRGRSCSDSCTSAEGGGSNVSVALQNSTQCHSGLPLAVGEGRRVQFGAMTGYRIRVTGPLQSPETQVLLARTCRGLNDPSISHSKTGPRIVTVYLCM